MPDLPAALTLLVLEDEPLIRMDMEDILRGAGSTVTTVATLEDARAILAERLPDVAILDALVPDGDTFALARELTAQHVAVVFVTGYPSGIPADLAGCPMVEKPFAPESLTAAVRAALAARA
jgi:DNA-binding response OmpR family regulator